MTTRTLLTLDERAVTAPRVTARPPIPQVRVRLHEHAGRRDRVTPASPARARRGGVHDGPRSHPGPDRAAAAGTNLDGDREHALGPGPKSQQPATTTQSVRTRCPGEISHSSVARHLPPPSTRSGLPGFGRGPAAVPNRPSCYGGLPPANPRYHHTETAKGPSTSPSIAATNALCSSKEDFGAERQPFFVGGCRPLAYCVSWSPEGATTDSGTDGFGHSFGPQFQSARPSPGPTWRGRGRSRPARQLRRSPPQVVAVLNITTELCSSSATRMNAGRPTDEGFDGHDHSSSLNAVVSYPGGPRAGHYRQSISPPLGAHQSLRARLVTFSSSAGVAGVEVASGGTSWW